ncbi:putative metal-dependent hydrolase with the TIM-barrel fold [Gaiella occulta]|uniref:Putative metal-dependent hydrolase with the TIM-barrel fold n=1 Tax=Gaiella occulta TaxID=1002870 RepID=A0A7M2YZG5_9ACTN|nr:amidohydrolase [Gaiella occulta]RDI75480.1 putative metal-dependent hydrolase with the TIM-barrel fold [Gaiella occulta]
MILDNGVIRTMDPSLATCGALALAGPLVAGGVGTHEWALPSPERVDLRGRCVLPAFTDAHVHFPTWALAQRDVRLDGAASLAEALDRVARHPRHGTWIRGTGWRDAEWAEKPDREALDAVSGDTPAALWAKDYHSLWLNSAALARAGGDLDADGGVVERDAAGAPTGILREESAWRFRERYVTVSEDEWVEATRAGIRVAVSRGVGAIHDKDGWLGAAAIFGRIHEREGLAIRVWQSLPAERVTELAALGLRSRIGDDFLRLGYLKTFMDGTLGSQTALMLDGSGVRISGRDELEETIRAGAAAGWPVSVHAIGDLANREALDAFEATMDVWRPLGLRHRIEHAQCLDPTDIERFARIGVACSVQFTHAPSDRDLAERLWHDRLEGAYAFRSLWEAGALLANGSDAPVEELDPLAGIRHGVLRTLDDRPGWRPQEALTVEQAIRASTVNPAWLAGDERRRGRLLPGFLADLVVLSRDPFGCPPEELATVEVVATMVGGRWVHNPPPWD